MVQNRAELGVLRRLHRENQMIIDLMEAQQQHNAVQDRRLNALEQKFTTLIQWLENQQNRDRNLQERLAALEAEVSIVNRTQAERIAELECLAHPYSLDGDAICNFDD